MHIVLVNPQIPQNTGSVARTCAALQWPLHLIHPMGFKIDESKVKRAGLDYWPSVSLNEHESLSAFRQATNDPRCWFIETCGEKLVWDAQFAPGDALVFGSETLGLSKELLRDVDPAFIIKLPMRTTAVRSLNLSNTVTAVSYEALRQNSHYYL